MPTRFAATAAAFLLMAVAVPSSRERTVPGPEVTVRRVPHGGIQPEVVRDDGGALHLLYFAGDPSAGDLFHVQSQDDGNTYTRPVRVNSQPGSAIATGTIRGGQIAVGKNGRVHVAWNGSQKALPGGLVDPQSGRAGPQFFHARSNDSGTGFEPQRGLMQRSVALDGGGSIAADGSGNVYAAWHGNDAKTGNDGEDRRRVWIARSSDAGRTFSAETPAWNEPTGACGCCGLRLLARAEMVYLMYRSATASTNRDVFLLVSQDKGKTFGGSRIHEWDINACPMTSMSFGASNRGIIGAWETAGQVYFAGLDPQKPGAKAVSAPPGTSQRRKHPRVAVDPQGDMLMVWAAGTGWARGGSVGWQVFNEQGQPLTVAHELPNLPTWSFAAAVPSRKGGFTIFY